MKNPVSRLLTMLIVSALLTACGGSGDGARGLEMTKERVALNKEILDLLSTVSDQATFDAMMTKAPDLLERQKDLADRTRNYRRKIKLDDPEIKALLKENDEILPKITEEINRIDKINQDWAAAIRF